MDDLGGGEGREAEKGLGGKLVDAFGGDLVEAFGGGRLGFWRKGREGFVGLADTFSLLVGGILEFALDDVFCL